MAEKEKTTIVNDSLLDEELMNMPGLRVNGEIHNVRGGQKKSAQTCKEFKPQQPAIKEHAGKFCKHAGKFCKSDMDRQVPADKHISAESRFVGNEWVPAKECVSTIDKVKKCAKSAFIFGGMGLLFFYWQQTGQMLESAAFPSIVVCAVLAGLGVGKNIK